MDPLAPLVATESARDGSLLLLVAIVAGFVVLALAFAGYTLTLRVRNNRRERTWERLSAGWAEPVLNALLEPEEADRVHGHVAPQDRLRFVRFLLEYSRRVRGEERAILKTLAEPYLEPLVERTLSPRVEVRTRAVQTLGTLGLPKHAGVVLSALEDESPVVAMVAARALCRKEHPEYAPAVLRHLDRFEVWSPGFLASMLAAVGPDAAPPLRTTLADPQADAPVRAVAAEALRLLTDLEAADAAHDVVADPAESRTDLVSASLRLLGVVGRPEHLVAIRRRCASEDLAVRAAACTALGRLGEPDDHPRLLGALGDPSPWVAIQAAKGLIRSGARPLLEELADSDHPRAELAREVLVEAGS